MTSDTPESGFTEDGLFWTGTREELEAWKQYKQRKALAFVGHGYSVSWYPDGDAWMEVYLPERHHAETPEILADIKFFRDPSSFGIDGGRVSKLCITRRRTDVVKQAMGRPYERVEDLFNYDRGPDTDRLRKSVEARKLYQIVLRELN
ncbi:MAG: hypothetical protein IT436_15920 [Phycisphaerales bacterium]|nr:hypothetical protein [Phycisphaerales bacterium]